jgi:hypothetical protein
MEGGVRELSVRMAVRRADARRTKTDKGILM